MFVNRKPYRTLKIETMKTALTFITGFLFIFLFPATDFSQSVKTIDKKTTTFIHPDYISQLLNEINAMRAKAVRLRARAATLSYEDQASALVYAELLERKSSEKQL